MQPNGSSNNGLIGVLTNFLPPWLHPYLFVVLWMVFPILMSAALLGSVLGWIPNPILDKHDTLMRQAIAEVVEHRSATENQFKELLGIQRQVCRNTSKSEAERVLCGR